MGRDRRMNSGSETGCHGEGEQRAQDEGSHGLLLEVPQQYQPYAARDGANVLQITSQRRLQRMVRNASQSRRSPGASLDRRGSKSTNSRLQAGSAT
jgi:hypothetical protein